MSAFNQTRTSTRLLNQIENELRPGEKITWSAQPIPGRHALASWGLVLFAIPWTAFAIFWIFAAGGFTSKTTDGPFRYFPLFGLPFLLIGLAMLTSPLWARKAAARTLYTITNHRAITLQLGWRGRVKIQSYLPADLHSLSRVENRDGSGDIIFRTVQWRDSDGDRRTTPIGFLGVPDVKTVENHLHTLAQQSPPPQNPVA